MVKQIVAVVGLVIFVSPAIAQQQSASPGTAPSATTAKPSPAAVQPGTVLIALSYWNPMAVDPDWERDRTPRMSASRSKVATPNYARSASL
jgi:hypothetical protein